LASLRKAFWLGRAGSWSGADHLPYFLKERYGFAQAKFLGLHALLVIDTKPEEQSPALVRKHIDTLHTKDHDDIIYVRAQVTAYNRKRLMEQKIPFIVPGNQMYLPMLAIDLREHFRRIRQEVPTFSPSTQVVVVYTLLRNAGPVLITAPPLGYSAVTMPRAFDELEAASLAEVATRGRALSAIQQRPKRNLIWEKAQPLIGCRFTLPFSQSRL
jgi:hypothetical protein